ncbi:MAG: ribosome maturation factor RimM [Pseudomonadota bacterium]
MALESEAPPLLAGRITGAYGIKGWVKVHAFTDPVSNFLEFGGWFSLRAGRQQPLRFLRGRLHGKGLVAQLADVDDRTTAESLRGTDVWVPASALPTLAPGDFYWSQLIGLSVFAHLADFETGSERVVGEKNSAGTDGLVNLGTVTELLETGANDVLVLQSTEESIDQRDRLIPFVDTVICEVDVSERKIIVDWHPDD